MTDPYVIKCRDLAMKLFPEMSLAEISDLLWEFTSFPFGSFEEVEMQLHEFDAKGEKS